MTVSGIPGSDGDREDQGRDEYGRDGGDDRIEGGEGPREIDEGDATGADEGAGEAEAAAESARIDWREGPDLTTAGVAAVFGAAPQVGGAADEPEQLPLGDDEVRLPWLEAGEDDDADQGGSTSQLMGFLVLGLLALGLIVGAIWWATRRQADDTLVADGSVITAPAQPYKEKPKDPGGKTFAGTGDTSFAVSEGQTRTTRLDQADAPPKPGFATVPKADDKAPVGTAKAGAAAASAQPGSAPAAAAGGVGVQVGAFSTKATAEAGWSKLQQQYSALSGRTHRVVEGKADIGTVYRLQAVAPDEAAARALCSQLRTAGLGCQVKN